jgi:hypothetical protein
MPAVFHTLITSHFFRLIAMLGPVRVTYRRDPESACLAAIP